MAYLLDHAHACAQKNAKTQQFMTTYITGFVVQNGTINLWRERRGKEPKKIMIVQQHHGGWWMVDGYETFFFIGFWVPS